jgi:transposase
VPEEDGENPSTLPRRRFAASEKQRIVRESYAPGMTVAAVARSNGVSRSLLFRWRKLAGTSVSTPADAPVVPLLAKVYALQEEVRELQRLLGKKTMENEILREAIELARRRGDSR